MADSADVAKVAAGYRAEQRRQARVRDNAAAKQRSEAGARSQAIHDSKPAARTPSKPRGKTPASMAGHAAADAVFKPKAKDSTNRSTIGPELKGSKTLLTEFILCFLILGLGTIIAPKGSNDGVPRLISRGTGLSLLFFILALVAAAGEGGRRAANGLGALVTVAYLVTSSDAKNILDWIKGFYSTEGVTPSSSGYVGQKIGTSPFDAAGSGSESAVKVDLGPLGTASERLVGSGIATGAGG